VKGTGNFELNLHTGIRPDYLFEKEGAYLLNQIDKITEDPPPGKEPLITNWIRIIKDTKQTNPEGYQLTITTNTIEIRASARAGAFYAIQSLLQLIPADAWKTPAKRFKLPVLTVTDAPRYEYRGLHLDIGRNFQNKVEIMRVLNWMAMYKLNKFHFHFTEDEAWRLEIPGLPELTTVGVQRGHTLDSKTHMPATYGSGGPINPVQSSFLSRQDYIELLIYAQSLHIQVIPEIETPGHARAAIKAMDARYRRLIAEGKKVEAEEYLLSDPNDQSVYHSAQNFTDNVMCVARPSVYHFIEKVVDELILMHKEAGVPLETVHLGGDEVPRGVWERSPLCQDLLKTLPNDKYRQTSDLWIYYWEKLRDMMNRKRLYISGWEEIGMRETKIDGNKTMMVNPTFANDNFHTYVWNTVVGWGTEDLPYRLANGGYKVVLCPVSNLYFDLAYMKDFEEPGYYWGGFLDVDKPFYFIPNDYLKNTKVDRFGNPIEPGALLGKDRLTDYGKTNIVGIQGHLWSENMRSAADLEYLALPKMLGLCERAWAPDPAWATSTDEKESAALYQKAWSEFVNVLGKKELPRLCWYQDGAGFRIPTVGAKVENGSILANIQLPGFTIRYTTDGSEPTASSAEYTDPIAAKGQIKLRAFDARGRGGRSIVIQNK
jgi:hexosaminidase